MMIRPTYAAAKCCVKEVSAVKLDSSCNSDALGATLAIELSIYEEHIHDSLIAPSATALIRGCGVWAANMEYLNDYIIHRQTYMQPLQSLL